MRVAVIEGSMRKKMNTARLVARVLDAMQAAIPTADIEILRTAEMSVEPCRVSCSAFCTSHPYQCALADDAMTTLERLRHADAVLLATPLYFRAPPARFHALMERLISVHFFHESHGGKREARPLSNTPCGLIGVTEYSNPQGILEYLADVSRLLGLKTITLDRFPYLGVGGQGDLDNDDVFHPLAACGTMAERLIAALTR